MQYVHVLFICVWNSNFISSFSSASLVFLGYFSILSLIPFLFAPLRTFVNIHVVREFIFSIRILKKLKCSFHLPTFTQCLCLTYLISYNINDLLSLSIISYQNLSFSIDIIANRIKKLVIFTEKNFKKITMHSKWLIESLFHIENS